ncbi:MAG: lipoyl synthase, partial [Pseudomonadota bacterium]
MVTLIDTTPPLSGLARATRHPEKAHRPDQPVLKKPDWIRVRAATSPVFEETRRVVHDNALVTVCEEAVPAFRFERCRRHRHACR